MKNYANDMDSSEDLQLFNIPSKELATKEHIDSKLRELLSKDMIEREYQPMINLNNQLGLVAEEQDEQATKDVKRRINLLQSYWCSFIIAERKLWKEVKVENRFSLNLRMNMLEVKMWNLTDYGADENTPISDTDKQWIIKTANKK